MFLRVFRMETGQQRRNLSFIFCTGHIPGTYYTIWHTNVHLTHHYLECGRPGQSHPAILHLYDTFRLVECKNVHTFRPIYRRPGAPKWISNSICPASRNMNRFVPRPEGATFVTLWRQALAPWLNGFVCPEILDTACTLFRDTKMNDRGVTGDDGGRADKIAYEIWDVIALQDDTLWHVNEKAG
jgi:hypothetical protein